MLPLICILADTLTQLVGNQLLLPSSGFVWHRGRTASILLSHSSPFGTDPILTLLEILTQSINSRRPDAQQPGQLCPLCFCIRAPNDLKYPLWRYAPEVEMDPGITVWLGWGLNYNNHEKKPCPTRDERNSLTRLLISSFSCCLLSTY